MHDCHYMHEQHNTTNNQKITELTKRTMLKKDAIYMLRDLILRTILLVSKSNENTRPTYNAFNKLRNVYVVNCFNTSSMTIIRP